LALMANSALNKLIIANVAAAVTVLIAYIVVTATSGAGSEAWLRVKSWIGLPLEPQSFLTHIYSLFLYMFIPAHPLAFLSDMLVLWLFGRRFAEFMGGKRLFPIFLFSGITGALITFGAYQALSATGYWEGGNYLFGGTAAVMGVMSAVAFLYPNLPLNLVFFGPVKLKYIALIYFILDVVLLTSLNSMAIHIASVGGILFGMTYALLYRRNFDLAGGFVRMTDFFKGNRRPATKMTVKRRPISDDQYNTMKQEKESTLDEILDKINTKGFKSLSKKERQLLEKYSRE